MSQELKNTSQHFDPEILNNTGFILSIPGILRADNRLRNKYRVHVLVAELFDLAQAHGYAYCSNLYLSKKMGVSVDTIKRDLKILEDCGYLRRDTQFQNFKRKRKIFVSDIFSNKLYQGARLPQPSVQECPNEESLSPNVDIKNIPKGISKDGPAGPPPLSFSSDVERLCETLVERIQSHGVKMKDPRKSKPTWNKWRRDMDKMIRMDKHSALEISRLITYAHEDHFWCQNILSPSKLRKHADTLLLQKNKKLSNPKKEDRPTINKQLAQKILHYLNENKKRMSEDVKNSIKYSIHPKEVSIGMREFPMADKSIAYDDPEFFYKLKSFLCRNNLQDSLT